MHTQIVEYTAQLLASPALMLELAAIENDFRSGITLNATDITGATIPLILNHPLETAALNRVLTQEPPKKVEGPFPLAYIYHIQSEYHPSDQEAEIRSAQHRLGISIYGSGVTPDVAELVVGRLAQAVTKLIERNQYLYGQHPRAAGASTVTYTEAEVSGQHMASVVVPFHLVFVVRMKERRNV